MYFTDHGVHDIRTTFFELFKKQDYVIDKSGVKTIEIINASFIADEDSIFGTPSSDWHERELEWYLSQSRNVNDIPPPIPKVWQSVADRSGFINSNYGWAVFSYENGSQYAKCFEALLKNPDTRQAIMIYNRPSMHEDAVEHGRNDFMCCQNVQYFIRDGELSAIVNFRSQDAVFGYKGDLFWNRYVHDKLYNDLLGKYPDLKIGPLFWNAMSIHVYERHFHLVAQALKDEIICAAKTIRSMTRMFIEENK